MKRSPIKRKTPLRAVSKKRAKVNKQRSKLVKELLGEAESCQAYDFACVHLAKNGPNPAGELGVFLARLFCKDQATQVHEPKTRARFPGSDTILDASNCVCLCAKHHVMVHSNVALSEVCGLLVRSTTKETGEPK